MPISRSKYESSETRSQIIQDTNSSPSTARTSAQKRRDRNRNRQKRLSLQNAATTVTSAAPGSTIPLLLHDTAVSTGPVEEPLPLASEVVVTQSENDMLTADIQNNDQQFVPVAGEIIQHVVQGEPQNRLHVYGHIQVLFEGHEAELKTQTLGAMLDSGSPITIIFEKTAKELNLNYIVFDRPSALYSVQNNEFFAIAQREIFFKYWGMSKKYAVNVYICRDPDAGSPRFDILLGRDHLELSGAMRTDPQVIGDFRAVWAPHLQALTEQRNLSLRRFKGATPSS